MSDPRRGGGLSKHASSAVLSSLIAFQSAAGARAPFAEVDPYTLGEPEALGRAGYVSFGPFLWGDAHSTEQIEKELGGTPLIWVETAHFKLGSSLPEYVLVKDKDIDERPKLRAELQRLAERLPRVDKKTLRLDPWLRLHLAAQRVEELYADFRSKLALQETDFLVPPETREKPTGPYLGLGGKFCVLLLQETSALDRYCRVFLGHAEGEVVAHYFPGMDEILLGLSVESFHGLEPGDTALHFALVYDLVLNFDTGFRGVTQPGPQWWRHGLARWFGRAVAPRIQLYATPAGAAVREDQADSDWPARVRKRVENGAFPACSEMLDWGDYSGWSFADHMIAWSRVDYLLNRGDGAARRFFLAIHEPVPYTKEREERIAAQRRGALEAATGLSFEGFDKAWCQYVKESYRRR